MSGAGSSSSRRLTLGIDLASQPKETAVCCIAWQDGRGVVQPRETRRLTDEVLLELIRQPEVTKAAVDAPFGWPLAFIDSISTYRDQAAWLDLHADDIRFRATDTYVREQLKLIPLSVAMSDLAWPAMRCARILSQFTGPTGVLDRSGGGQIAEVYPAAALRRWGLIKQDAAVADVAYKGDAAGRRERREQLMDALLTALRGAVDIPDDYIEACIADDDDLDAFVSALVARCIERNETDAIPPGLRWSAIREGWIHLPYERSLNRL